MRLKKALDGAGIKLPPLGGTGDASSSGSKASVKAPGDRGSARAGRSARRTSAAAPRASSSSPSGEISATGGVGPWSAQQVAVAKEMGTFDPKTLDEVERFLNAPAEWSAAHGGISAFG